MFLVLALALLSTISYADAHLSQECDKNWIQYKNHCYWRQATGKHYDAAKAECKTHNAYIAVPNSKSENNFIVSQLDNKPFTWIGFDSSNSERWPRATWEDGSKSNSRSWRSPYSADDAGDRGKGEPVLFIRPNGAWSFDPKTYDYPFICEKAGSPLAKKPDPVKSSRRYRKVDCNRISRKRFHERAKCKRAEYLAARARRRCKIADERPRCKRARRVSRKYGQDQETKLARMLINVLEEQSLGKPGN